MSTSATSKKQGEGSRRTVWAYIIVAAAAFLVDKIYALFAHGVSSPFMTYLFAYPLVLGAGGFLLLRTFLPEFESGKYYRLLYNMYNSGICILMTGSLLRGILDIAGTASRYIAAFFAAGGCFVAVALLLLAFCVGGERLKR